MPRVAVVIPIRNELSIADALLFNLTESLRSEPTQVYILVCDNCDDGSYEFLTSQKNRRSNIIVLNHVGLNGYGVATRVGYDFALRKNFEWAIVIDSDLSNPLNDVSLLRTILNGDSSLASSRSVVIKGNRFHNIQSTFQSAPFPRIFLTLSANILSRVLTLQISKDPTNGFRAVRLSWYAEQKWVESGFSSILEELYRAVKTNGQVQDFNTTLDFSGALRISSSFTFNKETVKGYLNYLFLIFYERICNRK